ncbi:MAG: substrate-binding domain-containing protein [Spirochaetes bacterium]|nr:substrate-binding domain-containing protein [Spirochaetota bacterium]
MNKRIIEGTFVNGELPTESKLVDELKVSKTTVRLAEARLIAENKIVKLQGKGTFVKGYTATGTVKRNIYVIANPHFRIGKLEYWDAVYDGIINALDYDRFALKLIIPPEDSRRQHEFMLQEQITSDNSSIIFLGEFPALTGYVAERRESLPMVRVGIPGPELIAGVSSDCEIEMLIAVKYLYSLGHRRIAFIGGFENDAGTKIKIRVLNDFAAAHSCTIPPAYIINTDYASFEAHLNAADRLMTLPERPTAVICINDQVAQTVCAGIKRTGFSIPDDVSVIGCDATSAQKNDPVLTTVDTHPAMIGKRALELAGTPGDKFWLLSERISPVLLIGKSTAPVRPEKEV